MNAMWAGRFKKALSCDANDFNSSISVDMRMFNEDISGSIAHAVMLGKQGIIDKAESEKIAECLSEILSDIQSGALTIDSEAEDIHMFVEAELTKRLGDTGKRLHTARSRNDQVALDSRMYVKAKIKEVQAEVLHLLEVIVKVAEANTKTIMPGYTHLQRAQPITFGHHLMAYAAMFMRDADRLENAYKAANVMPLGSCALAGTTYPIDRQAVADALGFESVCFNSIDGVSDRDYMIELAADIAIIMTHLSRFSEEIILWCSWEFKFLELDDAYSTGSSIMPQKKNPDIAELVRGKSGRVYGNLVAILTIMKGLPLAYNKDMQEDKECIFDSIDTVLVCLPIFASMLESATVLKDNMRKAADKGFINATDTADYLVQCGLPFRTAYKITGQLVAYAIEKSKSLGELGIDEFRAFSKLFDQDIYEAIDMANCVEKRTSFGGASEQSVLAQIKLCKGYLEKHNG